jgi:S1-C subfamily serine protease
MLQQFSNDLAATVAQAGHSTVRVEGRRRQAASGIVWAADGLIVTANHVVERDDNLRVGLPNGDRVNTSVVGRDPSTDIAVLRAEASGLTPAAWAAHDDLAVGHIVVAIGRPDASIQATLGIISALDEGWRTMAGGAIDRYVQTDVVMYPGFSGGPLVSAGGPFVGMNSSALMRGASVTLPASTLQRVVDSLVSHGKVKRGFLGVSAQPVRLPEAVASMAGQETGLLVVSVEGGSPADKGGLLLGDVLVSLETDRVRHMDDLMSALGGDRVGKRVNVRVLRGGQMIDLNVEIGERG